MATDGQLPFGVKGLAPFGPTDMTSMCRWWSDVCTSTGQRCSNQKPRIDCDTRARSKSVKYRNMFWMCSSCFSSGESSSISLVALLCQHPCKNSSSSATDKLYLFLSLSLFFTIAFCYRSVCVCVSWCYHSVGCWCIVRATRCWKKLGAAVKLT